MNQATKTVCLVVLVLIGLLVFNLTVSTPAGAFITYLGIVISWICLHTKIYFQRLTIERLKKEDGAKAD